MNKILALFSALLILAFAGCGSDKPEENTIDKEKEPVKTETTSQEGDEASLYEEKIMFTIEMVDGGVMKGELYPKLAPETVENFVALCDENFYDGLIFHRVIEGFMIQGGGYTETMEERPTDSIKGEFESNGFKNPLKHERGVLSMARTSVPDSASSQFFIMHDKAPHLDGEYAAFGRVTEGLDIIDEIATVETTVFQNVMGDFPVEPQVIKTIRIEK